MSDMKNNVKIFSLIWLDAQVNTTEDNRQTQEKLRQITNHLKTFEDQNQCHQYILSLSSQARLILIISGRYGRQLVPQIHHLPQLSSIYVYCRDKQANQQWAKYFAKVKSVVVRLDDLINQIEELFSINISKVRDHPDQLITRLYNSLLFIDVLIRMKSVQTDKQQLIKLCKNPYKNDEIQFVLVREYSELCWYSRNSFLYHFVIGDTYRQLKQNQCQTPVYVYRSQVMSNLQQPVGEFISINSFFSTSVYYQKALRFLNTWDNLHDFKSKPFVDISSLNDFGNECVFRLIEMKLCDDDEHDLKEVDLCCYGDILRRMGKYHLVEKMYRRLFDELLSDLLISMISVFSGSTHQWKPGCKLIRLIILLSVAHTTGLVMVHSMKGDIRIEQDITFVQQVQDDHYKNDAHLLLFIISLAFRYKSIRRNDSTYVI